MRQVWPTAALTAAALTALPVSSAVAAKQAERPITASEPDAMDIAKTPVTDLNLEKIDIPPLLQAAVRKPYELSSLTTCSEISAAVEQLDAILGPDIDLPSPGRDIISPGRVAKWAVSSFIPFRGLIRELSGANAQDQTVLAAARAGIARRSFLKGIGQTRGCKYPASPASPAIIQARALRMHQDRDERGKHGQGKDDPGKDGRAATPSMSAAALVVPSAEEEERLGARPTTQIAAADAEANRKGNGSSASVPFTSIPVVQKIP